MQFQNKCNGFLDCCHFPFLEEINFNFGDNKRCGKESLFLNIYYKWED